MTRNRDIRVCLDSRLIKAGEYFIPVVGENFDGHKFSEQAIKNGAVGILEESELYDLTRQKLRRVKPIIIAVTGSLGKTTTTSLMYQLLAENFNAAIGKLNTKLGLTVNTINDMPEETEVFIAEMGMERLGELRECTELFKPNIAVITNIDKSHAEKLGSIKNIAKAKFEIVHALNESGVAILNHEDKWSIKKAEKINKRTIWYGLSTKADINPINEDLTKLKLIGKHNILNVLAIVAVAKHLGMTQDSIENNLDNLKLPKGRLNLIKGINGSTLIDDTYNANAQSTINALEVLATTKGERKIAILGDMLELGKYSEIDHKNVGKFASKVKIDVLIAVGNHAKEVYNTFIGKKFWIETSKDFKALLNKNINIKKEDVVLLKGSQGIRMEHITRILMAEPSDANKLLVRQDITWK